MSGRAVITVSLAGPGAIVAVLVAVAVWSRVPGLTMQNAARRRSWAQFFVAFALLPALALGGLGATFSPAAHAAVPPTGSATNVTIGPGAYIVDMGQATQTITNGLRPYGLVYDLIRNQKIPVLWAISNTKARDGVDFVAGGKSYSGGAFVIAPQYAASAAATIATWKASGVVVDGPLTSSFTIPQFAQLTSWPRIVLDQANGSIAAAFYTNAGIPSSSYRIGTPAQLTPCDDLYVMPHADPTFATHQNLRPFNNSGGAIWAGCHAVSTLENIVDPSLGHIGNFSFLSTNGLVPFGSHGNGSPPYQYDGNPSDPIMQFKGSLDAATQNGSEQIYMPSLTSAWRPTTHILVSDPDQQNLVSVAGPAHGVSNGPATVLTYGRGFGNPTNGLVMYEAGHNVNTGNNPASVAAQRAFLNFNLLVGSDRAPTVKASASTTVNSGQSVAIGSAVSGGTPGYTYQWTSNCGGTFDAVTSPSGNWIAPIVSQPTPCILRIVVTDQCGRVNFDAVPLTVQPPPSSGGIIKKAYQNGVPVTSVAAGSTVTYVVSPTSSSPTNPSSDIAITDTASDGQNYVGGTLAKSGAGFTLTPPADGTALNNTPLATWSAAANTPSATSGVAKYLYGQNAQYGQTATVANSLAYQAAALSGYTPFIVHNTAGDTIVSAVNNNNTTNNNLPVTCTDITTNAVCTPATGAMNPGQGTPPWGNPVVIGTRVYFPFANNGVLACLDYANTTPIPCTGAANANHMFQQIVQTQNLPGALGGNAAMAGTWTANGNLYLLGENGGNIGLGCLTPTVPTPTNSIGTVCTGFPGAGGTGNSNGENIASPGGHPFVESMIVMGNGNVAFSTFSVTNNLPSAPFALYCININGATVTNCSGGAVSSLTATTLDARALRPVVSGGIVTGFCYGTYGAATPTGCYNSSGAAITTAPVPMPASLTVSGMSAIPVPGTSQVVYSTGTTADQLQCFDYATNTICGTSTTTGQSVYGATFLPNTTCVISYGATNTVGWKVWDTAKALASSGPNCVTNTPTYTFSDPAPRYCAPDAGVTDWGNLTLTSAAVIGVGAVVTYVDTATSAVLATVTVTAAMGGGTTTVTIPKPAGVSYATSKNLTVTVQTPAGAPAPGTTITATLANTTSGNALPQICYQARVPVCNVSVSNAVNANGVGAFTDSGALGLNCLQPPVLTIVKDPSPTTITHAGQTVTYSFIVTNIGGLPASNITVTDTQAPPATQGNLSSIVCPQTTLTQNQSMTCTATYTPTQADVDSGAIQDSATASGTDPFNNPITSQPFAAVVTAQPLPALSITKTSTTTSVAAVGDVIPYTFTVTNSGNITLFDVTAADVQQPPAGSLTDPLTCPVTSVLAPGGTFSCTASYTVTQADLDNGNVTDTATASGFTVADHDQGEDQIFSAPATLSVPVDEDPSLHLTKLAVPTSVSAAGAQVTYHYSVTNTGNVTISGVLIADPLAGLSALTYMWPGTVGVLAPGQEVTATATYVVTQADVNAGSILNIASASGTDPAGSSVLSNSASATVTATQGAALSIQKTVTPTSATTAGQGVTFHFSITNTGNVSLTGVVANEGTFTGSGALSPLTYTWPTPTSPGVLAPGEVATATATYTLTQADVDAGGVSNNATATGTPPSGTPVTSAPSTATVTVPPAPALTVVKSASSGGQPVTALAVGEVINYALVVTNTGNVTLSSVAVSDTTFTGSGTPPTVSCPITTLAPTAQVTCTAAYTVTLADVDAGVLTNTARATGTPPTGSPVTSGPSTVNAPGVQLPGLSLQKTVVPSTVTTAGQSVTFEFRVTNTGNVTLTGVVVNEGTFTGTGTLSPLTYTWPGTVGHLAPGQAVIATASYVVTQADVDAGGFSNSATASGIPPGSVTPITSSPSTATVTAPPAPSITIEKTAVPTSVTAAGQGVTFHFSAANTGNVTLTGVVVNEGTFTGSGALSGLTYIWPGPVGVLEPGQAVTATATYSLSQADVDAGGVSNTATASGTPQGSVTPITSSPSTATVTVAAAPALTFAKTAVPTVRSAAGQGVTFHFSITNTGNVTLTGVVVDEGLFTGSGALSSLIYTWPTPSAPGELAPGEVATASATYSLTQADVDGGGVSNTATARGTPPSGTPLTSGPSTATVTVTAAPSLVIAKLAVPTTASSAGDPVTYHYSVQNTGNVTVTGVLIADELPGLSALTYTWPGAVGVLAPGQVVTATASYAVTQADVDAGKVVNTATASGTDPTGASVASNSASATVTIAPTPALTIVKTATPTSASAADAPVTFTFTITNTGNVTLTGVVANEGTFTGSGTLSPLIYTWPTPGSPGVLTPGQVADATATYTLTQADVDAGGVSNTAKATGTPPSGTPVTSTPSTATVSVASAPALTLVKSATTAGSPVTVLVVPEVVTYAFVVTNTGNVTLTGLVVGDTNFTGSGTPPVPSCPVTTLAPGDQVTCTATYTVTLADVDSGELDNTAVAHGTPPSGTAVDSAPSTVMLPITQSPSLTIAKTVEPTTVTEAGQSVTFSFAITNTGNVTLHGVVANEGTFTGSGTLSSLTYAWPTPALPGVLIPGDVATATATYEVTQADMDAGGFANTATASGIPPGTATPITSGSSTATVTADPTPALTIQKRAEPTSVSAAGQGVTFSFTITNTGNVTLHGVVANEGTFTGSGTLSSLTYTWPAPSSPGVLAPGEVATATATYAATQADVDAGLISNTATASGIEPDGVTGVTSDPSTVFVTAAPTPALTIQKTADPMTVTAAGQSVTFGFTITNTGNVTLSGVSLTDGLPGLSGLTFTWPGTVGILAPTQVATATGTYTATQSDIDAGAIVNTATASGLQPFGVSPIVSGPATVTVTAPAQPGLSIQKTADPTSVSAAGATVTYHYTITNTGDVTMSGVSVNDALPGLSALTYTWPGAGGVLAPSDVATATATYVVTQADVDAGAVLNTATATGSPPTGPPLTSAPSTATVTIAPAPALTVVKSATSAGQPVSVLTLGQVIDYAFVVTNTGNVTLSSVAVTDTVFTGSGTPPVIGCPAASLAPGAQMICTATYTVTQADVDAGVLTNTARAAGTPPSGPPVDSAPSSVTVPAVQLPALTIHKAADPTLVTEAGQGVTFHFTITNTGNLTVHGVTVDEGTFTGSGTLSSLTYTWPGTPGVLIPGQVATATATYVLTQADVDAGGVSNTASAAGTAPSGAPVTSASSTATVSATPAPALTVVKSATSGGQPVTVLTLGQVIDYAFVVTNTGNVTLHGVAVTDTVFTGSGPHPVIGCPATSLAPGAQVICTAAYTVTQADVDAGQLTNTAVASGDPPVGTTVTSEPSSVTVPAEELPALTVAKTADPLSVSAAGQSVTFTFTITNTGNVTLHGVVVDEGTFSGTGALSPLVYTWPGSPGVLIPGQIATATATYVLTQADVDAGGVANTATATGTDPAGTSATSEPSTATVTATPSPGLQIQKRADPLTVAAAGDIVTYSFTIANTGNVTLRGVAVQDQLPGLSALIYLWPGAPGVLAPSQSATATATYVVTQSDMDAGSILNTATATGKDPGGGPVRSNSASAAVTAAPAPDLTIQKAADPPTVSSAGATVTFRFTVSNTGNVTLTGVVINEGAFSGTGTLSALTYSWPGTPGVLAPGQQATAIATYIVTQGDVDAGGISNTATASGTDPSSGLVSSKTSTANVTATASPALALVKSASPNGVVAAGDTLTYTFTITNTGNLTLTGVTVHEGTFTGTGTLSSISYRWPGVAGSLAPGATAIGTATYIVTTADMGRSTIENTATASAVDAHGTFTASASSTARTSVVIPASFPVTQSPPVTAANLPVTGTDIGRTVQGGVALIIVGLALVTLTRRRTVARQRGRR